MRVLAIDPGSAKCGVAIVEPGRVVHQEIVLTQQLSARVAALRADFLPGQLLLGNGTQSKTIAALFPEALLVPEAFTSQRARERLRRTQSWWQRLRPLSAPYDDMVAVILAEDWLAAQATH